MTYRPEKSEWWIFKRCGNCRSWNFKWTVKPQKIFVKQINQVVTSQVKVCKSCAKKVEEAVKERNI